MLLEILAMGRQVSESNRTRFRRQLLVESLETRRPLAFDLTLPPFAATPDKFQSDSNPGPIGESVQ